MAKASDNPFPSLLIVEGSAPASPAAGQQRLFIDSADHTLKRKDSSGAVTAIGGSGGGGSTIKRVRVQGAATADYSTASTAFVDLDNTYFSTSIAATVGDEIEVGFESLTYNAVANAATFVAAAINGVIRPEYALGHGMNMEWGTALTLIPLQMRYGFKVASGDLVSGAVPIKIQWRVSGGTGKLRSQTSSSNANVPQLTVVNWGQ